MAVTKKKPTFETSDGREFDTKQEAERHEELTTARRTYVEARRQYTRALASSHKTADGEQFETGAMRTYYYVTKWVEYLPRIGEVSFYFWNCDIDDKDEGVIVQDESDGRNHRRVTYRISELYYHKKNALKALHAEQTEHIARMQAIADGVADQAGISTTPTP